MSLSSDIIQDNTKRLVARKGSANLPARLFSCDLVRFGKSILKLFFDRSGD